MNSLFNTIFGCAHNNTTFPLTPFRKSLNFGKAPGSTYVVCLDCGKEFEYDWKEMRIGDPVGNPHLPPPVAHSGQAVTH